MRIHVVGDSHSAYCFENFIDAQIYWLGPVTMHRFARNGFDILDEILLNPSRDDLLVIVAGEIDIRCHLVAVAAKYNRSLDDVAREVATNFVQRLSVYANRRKIRAVVSQPMFPADRRPNPDLPFIGTVDERLEAHRILSHFLSERCYENGISFVRMPTRFQGRDGLLNRKYSDDGVHIVPCEGAPLARSLQKVTGMRQNFRKDFFLILKRRLRYYTGQKLRRVGIPKIKPIEIFTKSKY